MVPSISSLIPPHCAAGMEDNAVKCIRGLKCRAILYKYLHVECQSKVTRSCVVLTSITSKSFLPQLCFFILFFLFVLAEFSKTSKASSYFVAFDFKTCFSVSFERAPHFLTLFSQYSVSNPVIDSNTALIKALARLCEYNP